MLAKFSESNSSAKLLFLFIKIGVLSTKGFIKLTIINTF